MDRTILHCDMNSFYASVELLSHPELADGPVAVSGRPDDRHGIILAKNEAAKKFGVKTAETIWQARRKCPNLVLLPPHHELYEKYCDEINAIYLRYTDQVEPFSIDESWLDVTGSLRHFATDGEGIAKAIHEDIRRELGLKLSIGVSYNKVMAKMGSDYKKPDATTVITRDNFRTLLWPLPCRDLFFVGAGTAQRLASMNIRTIGGIAQADVRLLRTALGKHGEQLHAYANGEDDEPVRTYEAATECKSVGNGMTFRRNLEGRQDVRTAVAALCDKVCARLRRKGVCACGVKVDIKDTDLRSISRQVRLDGPTDLSSEMQPVCMDIIDRNWDYRDPIRLLAVTGINVVQSDTRQVQISLFDTEESRRRSEESKAIENTLDSIKDRYGRYSIVRGSILGNDLGISYRNSEMEIEEV